MSAFLSLAIFRDSLGRRCAAAICSCRVIRDTHSDKITSQPRLENVLFPGKYPLLLLREIAIDVPFYFIKYMVAAAAAAAAAAAVAATAVAVASIDRKRVYPSFLIFPR